MALVSSLFEAFFYFVCAVLTALHISIDSMAVSVSPSPVGLSMPFAPRPFTTIVFSADKKYSESLALL